VICINEVRTRIETQLCDSNYHDRITTQAIPTTITTSIPASTFHIKFIVNIQFYSQKLRKHQFGPRMVIFGQGTGSDTSDLYTH